MTSSGKSVSVCEEDGAMRKTIFITVSFLLSLLLLPGVVCVAQDSFEELEYGNGRKLFVLLPSEYNPEQEYPSVYFMPQDGFSAEKYLDDGIDRAIRELEQNEDIPAMIYVFPQFRIDEDMFGQMLDAVEIVQGHYPAIDDTSMRGAIGSGVGGYLSLLMTYTSGEQQLGERPSLFVAAASHDGDFTSEKNPFPETYGDLYSILQETVRPYGKKSQWINNFYTYLDCNSDNVNIWEKGETPDIASLFRTMGQNDPENPLAWDYSVFEYSIRPNYGTYLDNIGRSLKGIAGAFRLNEDPSTAETETEIDVQETIVSGDDRLIDLMGDWYFRTASVLEKDDAVRDTDSIDSILKTDWENWDVVQPGLDWWDEDFASCLGGNPWYTGSAWYVRQFEVPEGFDAVGLQLKAGMVDEADEIFLNGLRIGQTGIPVEGGSYDGSNPWDEERIYPIPDNLLAAGLNTIAVRVYNSTGAGGWFSGPIQIECARKEGTGADDRKPRFYTDTFTSDSLKGREVEYRVYLPEGYYESDLRYPVVYMLHGYGSTGKSFEIAGVPEVLDEGIASGEVPPCIVIFPSDSHPDKASWWSGVYADMLNKDLIEHVDGSLRTVDSREYRFLAGESMGGAGAYLNALRHPELYAGVFDIYGGLRYNGALEIFLGMDADELSKLRHYIICGNHDMYCFDIDHIKMGRHLSQLEVPCVFEIDNGEHDPDFYLPRLKDGFAYILNGIEPVQ